MNASAVRVCVVGSANVDLTFRTPRLPRAGETISGSGFHLAFGGKGANQAVAAARLGASVAFVARLGNDAFGRDSIQHLRDEGLDTTHVRIDAERPSGVAGIVVDDSAQNCIVVVPGANGALSPADVRHAAATISTSDVLLCQLEVPLETTQEAFRIARSAGVRTILTPAPAAPLPDELLHLTDLLVPNETELELLTDRQGRDIGQLKSAVELIRARGAKAVVVTLGERGAMFLEDGDLEFVPPFRVRAVDPTGAGDSFTAALAVYSGEGLPLRDAARRAAAVGAIAVTRLGAQTAFPTRAEVEMFLKDIVT